VQAFSSAEEDDKPKKGTMSVQVRDAPESSGSIGLGPQGSN
jgi:hypothetical protein